MKNNNSIKCIKCKSSDLKVIKSGPHNKLVCKNCLAFQKFLNEKDKDTFNKTKGEDMVPNIIKWNEELFNKFIDLSFKIKNAAGIIQNDMETNEDTKKAINDDIEYFKQTMTVIKLELNDLEKAVLNHIQPERSSEAIKRASGAERYDSFMKNLVKNTKKLNEEVPWET